MWVVVGHLIVNRFEAGLFLFKCVFFQPKLWGDDLNRCSCSGNIGCPRRLQSSGCLIYWPHVSNYNWALPYTLFLVQSHFLLYFWRNGAEMVPISETWCGERRLDSLPLCKDMRVCVPSDQHRSSRVELLVMVMVTRSKFDSSSCSGAILSTDWFCWKE